jgi:hypothetical protein
MPDRPWRGVQIVNIISPGQDFVSRLTINFTQVAFLTKSPVELTPLSRAMRFYIA